MSDSHTAPPGALVHLETLKVFCDVVETKSFSVAASQNYVTQSAVSQQIRMLEEKYGRRLLERTRGNVQLTPAGALLYQASKEIVQRYQDLEGQLQAVSKIVAGTLRVATVHSIGLYELSLQLKRFLKAYPQVQLQLQYSRSNKIYDDALKGGIDLGIVAFPTRRPGITVIPFREDHLVLVCPPQHPLAKHKQVSIKKLAGEPFVGFERDIPTRKETDRVLHRHGIDVRYVMELDNVEIMKRVVEIGIGLAILPENAVRPDVKGGTLAAVHVSDEVFLRPLGIIHRTGKHFSPAAAKFIENMRSDPSHGSGRG
jgi:DNA-binding transcriptional LysR family regulator